MKKFFFFTWLSSMHLPYLLANSLSSQQELSPESENKCAKENKHPKKA
jgi:hypothetical protein